MESCENRNYLSGTLMIGTVVSIVSFGISFTTGCVALLLTVFWFTSSALLLHGRNRRLKKLAMELDSLLHGDFSISLEEYQEGELAILQNELKKVTGMLREQTELLMKEKKYLADSIADISHQIRTPLTSLNLILSNLSDETISMEEKQKKSVQACQLTGRISWLIEALLKLAKLDANTIVFEKRQISLQEVVKRAAAPFEIALELHNQKLELSQLQDTVFEGDLEWTAEAVGNVIKNCMEHCGDGGQIYIRSRKNAVYTELVIEDDGPGIAAEDLPHLFERFYKGQHSGMQNVGIGLALSRTILARENATIQAENRRNGGACFQIRMYNGIL